EYLKDYGDGRVEILKCAHHGSAIGSNSREFIAGITPCLAVISCGENNRYGHPHKETLENLEEAGVQVARTDELGAVSVSIKGKAFVLSYKSVE
ncbi:MAG: MBL fold metallo-hydrolase, partial [Lachnospiraceae bacterium]|nr:MBL fold metallo-hydrolase [Lachnospiraceae bacterium]